MDDECGRFPLKGAEEVNCKTVSFTANLSGKRDRVRTKL